MNKSQKTWTVLILVLVIAIIVLTLIWKFWQMVIVGGIAFVFGYIFGWRQGKGKKKEVKN